MIPEGRVSRRGRRALSLIALSLVVIVATGLMYLHPSLPSHLKGSAPAKAAGPPLLSNDYLVAYDFLTTTLGWALVADQASSSLRFWVFRTTDGAKTWQVQFTGRASAIGAAPLRAQFFDRDNGLIALGGQRAQAVLS